MRSAFGYLGLAGSADESDTAEAPPRRADGGTSAAGAHLGSRLSFRGEVGGEGDFQILGKFEGEIKVTGRVIVGEGAQVDANIDAAAIVIGGTVRGNLSATTRVEILPSGVLTGTLRTGAFTAADGASVKGEIWVERPAAERPQGARPAAPASGA
jgi:cytoskeletal protein CcmA (bactofilin family)